MKNIKIDHLKVTSNITLNAIPTYIDVATSEKKKEKELDKIRIKLSKPVGCNYLREKRDN